MRLPVGFLLLFIERDDKYFIASKNEEPYKIQDSGDNEDYLISSSNETVFKAVRSLEQSFNIIKKHLS